MNLYALGSNGSGQLSLSHTEDVSTPTKCRFDSPPDPDDEIIHIAAGGNHTLLLTNEGYVYAAGCNADGRCGPTSSPIRQKKRHGQDQVTRDATGGHDDDLVLRFQRVVLEHPESGGSVQRFKCVSATWEGSILVAGPQDSSIRSDENDCARDHEKEITNKPASEDKVFVLGSTPKGELGLGPNTTTEVTPGTSIPNFPPPGATITVLASGMGHSVAVLSNGEVYGWGGARKGQLGEDLKSQKIVWSPARMEGIPFRAAGAVCGREFTVVFGQTGKGELVFLGDRGNRWGISEVPSCLSLRGAGILDIGASWHGIYVHRAPAGSGAENTSDGADGAGSIVAWGRDDHGQLPPPDLPSPIKIAVGSEHVLALLDDGSVAAFGWGEHGNCGPNTDSRGNVSGTYNVIELPDAVRAAGGRVVGLGAGCATSWLIVK